MADGQCELRNNDIPGCVEKVLEPHKLLRTCGRKLSIAVQTSRALRGKTQRNLHSFISCLTNDDVGSVLANGWASDKNAEVTAVKMSCLYYSNEASVSGGQFNAAFFAEQPFRS